MKVPETKPVVSSSSSTSVSTPAPKRKYATEGLDIGDYTDKGYKVIGKTPDKGIPYIALDENYEYGMVIVSYGNNGLKHYCIDTIMYERLTGEKRRQDVQEFLDNGGTIG